MLSGRVAIVTGGGQGIGRAIAIELANRGAHVVVADLDVAAAAAVAAEVEMIGRQSLALHVDVSVQCQVEAMVSNVSRRMGHLDILVNNAGVHAVRPFLDITEQEWDRVLAVNVKGVLFGIQAAARTMIRQGNGRIVNIASISGKQGNPLSTAYAASKAAVISITRSAALALAPHGITVNAVCPGAVRTAMWERIDLDRGRYEGAAPGEVLKRRAAQVPLGRLAEPDDVARVAAFLSSDGAGYVTGQAVNVCGGVMMH